MRSFSILCSFLLFSASLSVHAVVSAPLAPGTRIVVRTIDKIESKQAEVGQSYRCTVDTPVVVDGKEAAPRGADCVLRIVELKEAGKLQGNNGLQLELAQIRISTNLVDVSSDPVVVEGKGKGKSSGIKTGIGAAAGAGLGGLFGGGKGAAIGAGVGAAGGAATSALTKGPEIKVVPETLLTFAIR